MRKYINLIETGQRTDEAPIGDISFMGGDAPASFQSDDIGIFKSDKWKQKVRRVLEKAPIMINLAFVNHTKGYADPDRIGDPNRTLGDGSKGSGVMSPEEFKSSYGFDIEADPNALTAVFAFNEGTERRPMTPWIIAHRLTHLIEESDYNNERPFSLLLMGFQFGFSSLGYAVTGPNSADALVHHIGTTKAARDGELVSFGEFIAECFAQYLVQGRVILKPLQGTTHSKKLMADARQNVALVNDAIDNPSFEIPDPAAVNYWLSEWVKIAEKKFAEILNEMVGKIAVM